MSGWDKFLFYARKSMGGILVGTLFGTFSYIFVERAKVKGSTSAWVQQHDASRSRPESEEYARQRLQQELWVETLFADIPDETKERVTKRWTGKSYLEEKAKTEKARQEFIEAQIQKSLELKEFYKQPLPPKEPRQQKVHHKTE